MSEKKIREEEEESEEAQQVEPSRESTSIEVSTPVGDADEYFENLKIRINKARLTENEHIELTSDDLLVTDPLLVLDYADRLEGNIPQFKYVNAELVDELTMLPLFQGKIIKLNVFITGLSLEPHILTTHVVYRCRNCERVKLVTLGRAALYKSGKPISKCRTCGGTDIEIQKAVSVPCRLGSILDSKGNFMNDVIFLGESSKDLTAGYATLYATPVLDVTKAMSKTKLLVLGVESEFKKYKNLLFAESGSGKPIRVPIPVLIDSLAPDIVGLKPVKLLLLCLMVGGYSEPFVAKRKRSLLNMLMIGDPGVGKSTLALEVQKIIPKSFMVTPHYVTKAGLLASLQLTERGREIYMGVLPLLDGEPSRDFGILIVTDMQDLVKRRYEELESLRQAMEEQVVTYSKAGVSVTFHTRVAFLGIMNPMYGVWKDNLSPLDNIGLRPQDLSRFDVIVNIRSRYDRALYDKILEKTLGVGRCSVELMSIEELRRYIIYARSMVPKFTPETVQYLKQKQDELIDAIYRLSGIPVNPRIVLSIVRLSASLAKLELMETVTPDHVDRAISLLKYAYQTINMLQEDAIDIHYLYTNVPSSERELVSMVHGIVAEMCRETACTIDDVIEEVERRISTLVKNSKLNYSEFMKQVRRKGYTDLKTYIKERIIKEILSEDLGVVIFESYDKIKLVT